MKSYHEAVIGGVVVLVAAIAIAVAMQCKRSNTSFSDIQRYFLNQSEKNYTNGL
jgi:hypothetical protein